MTEVTGLTPGAKYTLWVAARNAAGGGVALSVQRAAGGGGEDGGKEAFVGELKI